MPGIKTVCLLFAVLLIIFLQICYCYFAILWGLYLSFVMLNRDGDNRQTVFVEQSPSYLSNYIAITVMICNFVVFALLKNVLVLSNIP